MEVRVTDRCEINSFASAEYMGHHFTLEYRSTLPSPKSFLGQRQNWTAFQLQNCFTSKCSMEGIG